MNLPHAAARQIVDGIAWGKYGTLLVCDWSLPTVGLVLNLAVGVQVYDMVYLDEFQLRDWF